MGALILETSALTLSAGHELFSRLISIYNGIRDSHKPEKPTTWERRKLPQKKTPKYHTLKTLH